MSKAYWISAYRAIHDPEALAPPSGPAVAVFWRATCQLLSTKLACSSGRC
jgi:hypothetical protein